MKTILSLRPPFPCKITVFSFAASAQLKLPFRSKLINFLKTYFQELAYIYYDNASKESKLSFEEKTTQRWLTYFQIAGKY